MKKCDYLNNAKHYYNMQEDELTKNGDTLKRREYIHSMCENIKEYRRLGGTYIDTLEIYEPLKYLYDEYYNELIFTPCKEDFEDMREWI